MTALQLAVTGATGRMGGAVIDAAAGRDIEVVCAVSRSANGEHVGDVSVSPASALEGCLRDRAPNALIDFTGPASSVKYAEQAARAGVPVVIGTTGFDDAQAERLEAVADRVALLRAANFSRGVHALGRAIRVAAEALPGYDVELTETHHNAKTDAPSGTAKELLGEIEAIRGPRETVHGRQGEAPRQAGEIGVHARRAGDVTGEHEVLLAGNHEVLELTHRAGNRGVFAAGAVDAAEWIAGRDPGYYDFSAVIDDL